MTRYNDTGMKKRKYVEATQFGEEEPEAGSSHAAPSPVHNEQASNEQPQAEPKKKKRKRGKPRKSQPEGVAPADGSEDVAGPEGGNSTDSAMPVKQKPVTKAEKGKKKLKEKRGVDARKFASERRRMKRQDEREVYTTCYACREQGHAARHCPKALAADGEGGGKKQLGKQVVGICYRCGSRKHSLSKCPKLADPENSLPFASCFVCSGKGHLASSCTQNQSKGVYPNGGCCKLCGETTHLAKNCTLRKNEPTSTAMFVGTGAEAGADEDDFHTFKRKSAEVNKEEKADERRKKSVGLKVGAMSGAVRTFGQAQLAPKKVVTF